MVSVSAARFWHLGCFYVPLKHGLSISIIPTLTLRFISCSTALLKNNLNFKFVFYMNCRLLFCFAYCVTSVNKTKLKKYFYELHENIELKSVLWETENQQSFKSITDNGSHSPPTGQNWHWVNKSMCCLSLHFDSSHLSNILGI